MFKQLITWLYWKFCWREDDHNRRTVVMVCQNEPTPDAAKVLMNRFADIVNGEPARLTGVKIYNGRGKLVRDLTKGDD